MKIKHIVPLVSVAAVISLMGAGCNPLQSAQKAAEQKVADSIASGILSKASNGKVDVNTANNQMQFKDNKTGNTVSFGENLSIPADFPKDVPIYPGSKASSIMSSQTDKTANATLTTSDDSATVIKWYEGQFSGWKEDENSTINNVEVREYSKDTVKITVSVWPQSGDQTGSFITLSRSEEKPASSAGN